MRRAKSLIFECSRYKEDFEGIKNNLSLDRKNKNALIVNYNTQRLTDNCIRSINKHVKNINIFIFDNSDKDPYINTFPNAYVLDNTKGDILDFDKYLSDFKDSDKDPLLNNFGTLKHTLSIQKFIDILDDSFVLLDSDTIVKKDFSDLIDNSYAFVGEIIGEYCGWKERLAPYICFINAKRYGVNYFDPFRIGHLYGNIIHDTGASFLEDAQKYPHKLIKVSDYVDHLGGGSWKSPDIDSFINYHEQYDTKISIIIPCYNHEKYIKETIDSIKSQKFKDFSCIIINDGSTDNSENIILSEISGDQRFRYFKVSNHGPGCARNFGAKKSNSEYILFLDSDDIISPNYISDAIKYLDEHKDIALYYGNYKLLSESGEEEEDVIIEGDFSYYSLLMVNPLYVSVILRRTRFDEVSGFNEDLVGFEDWEFFIRYLYGDKKVYKSSDFVFYYRQHGNSRNKCAIDNKELIINEVYKLDKKIYDEYKLVTKNRVRL